MYLLCLAGVLRHHLLPLTLCAAPVSEGRLSTTDLEGELVRLARDEAGQIMVDDKGRVVQEDIVATNGVVHVLDKVLTPKSGLFDWFSLGEVSPLALVNSSLSIYSNRIYSKLLNFLKEIACTILSHLQTITIVQTDQGAPKAAEWEIKVNVMLFLL